MQRRVMPSCKPKRASSCMKSRTRSAEKAMRTSRKRVRRAGKAAASLSFFFVPRPRPFELCAQALADQAVHGAVSDVEPELLEQPLLRTGVPREASALLHPLPQRLEDTRRQSLLLRLGAGGAGTKQLLQAAAPVCLKPVPHAVAMHDEVFGRLCTALHLAGADEQQQGQARAQSGILRVLEPVLKVVSGFVEWGEGALGHQSNLRLRLDKDKLSEQIIKEIGMRHSVWRT